LSEEKIPPEWKAKVIDAGAQPQTFKGGMVNSDHFNSRSETCRIENSRWKGLWQPVMGRRGVQNTCWDQEEQNSHSQLCLLAASPGGAKASSLPGNEKLTEKSHGVTFYRGTEFLTEIDLLHFCLQNATK